VAVVLVEPEVRREEAPDQPEVRDCFNRFPSCVALLSVPLAGSKVVPEAAAEALVSTTVLLASLGTSYEAAAEAAVLPSVLVAEEIRQVLRRPLQPEEQEALEAERPMGEPVEIVLL
jgi:hypothetical protein